MNESHGWPFFSWQEALIQLNKLKFLLKSLWSACSESAHSLMCYHQTNYSNTDSTIRYHIIKAHIWSHAKSWRLGRVSPHPIPHPKPYKKHSFSLRWSNYCLNNKIKAVTSLLDYLRAQRKDTSVEVGVDMRLTKWSRQTEIVWWTGGWWALSRLELTHNPIKRINRCICANWKKSNPQAACPVLWQAKPGQ